MSETNADRIGRLGMGAMLAMLGGDRESGPALRAAIGKRIASAAVGDNVLTLRFDDGGAVVFDDDGQSCCEHRYLTCDDDLGAFVGATLLGAEVRDGGEAEDEYGNVHESQFLVVSTSLGAFTVAAHNEHNGYYGGIVLRVRALGADQ